MMRKHAAVALWLARDAREASRALDLPPDALRALGARRLRALLVAAQRAPFHAERMRAAGLTRPAALRDLELPIALQSLAPLSKRELLAAGDAALHDGRVHESWFSSRSSGSSGEPFRVWYDARAWATLKYLVKARARRAAGMRWTDRVAILDAIPVADEGSATLERMGRLRRISVFREPAEIACMLAAYQPAAIYALPSVLLELARTTEVRTLRARANRVFTSGELLTPDARRTIASAFGADVRDVYGTSETKEITWECHAGSRHVSSNVVHVEILDERDEPVAPGDEGEIVVTLLVNRAMPLVRYRTGDRGTLRSLPCPCGRAGPVMGIVSGRETDTLELPDGTTRSPYQLTMALEHVPDLAQYQIVQSELSMLRVSAVLNGDARDTAAGEIERALRAELPANVRVEVEIVDRLARGARAKVRAVHPLPRSQALRSAPAASGTAAGS